MASKLKRSVPIYDDKIPFINIKGAIVICLVVFLIPTIVQKLIANVELSSIISGIIIGFSIAFATYELNERHKNKKGFVIVFIIFSLISIVVIYLQFKYRILI